MDNAPDPLDQFHTYEKAAKLAMADGNRAAAEHLRDLAKQQLMAHYQATDNYDPAAGQGNLENFRAGMGQGMVDVARHVGNLIPGVESDQDMADAKERDAPLLNTGAGAVGSFIGQTAATAPLGVGTSAAVSRLGSAGARLVANGIGRGILEGGTQGAVMADPGHGGAGAIAGGVLGGSLPLVGGAVSKAVRGLSRTPAAQMLLNAGVSLTPGMLKPGGFASMVEQAPVLRWLMSGPKKAARGDWQHAMSEAVAAPGTQIPRGTAEEMLQKAKQSFDPLYAQADGFPVAPRIMSLGGGKDVPLNVALQKAAQTPGVTKEIQATANDWLQSQLKATISKAKSSGGMLSDHLRDLRSAIREKARAARASGDTAGGMYDDVYSNAEDSITQALESQLPPGPLKALKTADGQYVHFKQLESAFDKAAGVARGEIGPTPVEVTRSVKTGAKQAGRSGQFARGQNKSRLRELADAAGATFAETPEMRTGHSLPFLGLIGLGGAAAVKTNPWTAIPTLTGALGLGMTRTGRRAAAGQLPWQKMLSQKLDQIGGTMGPLNKALLGEYTQRGLVNAEQPDAQYMLGMDQ